MKKIIICISLLIVAYLSAYTNNENSYQIKNFGKKIYKASNQNWSVSIAPNGYSYFANHWGLLEFDGISWKLYQLPNKTILRTVLVVSDSLIYTGGYREFGYWKVGHNGSLSYYSLNQLAEKYFSKNEEFWNISQLGDAIYFHTYSKIYRYADGEISPVEVPSAVYTQHKVRDKILIAVRDKGIYSVEGTRSLPYVTGDFFTNKIIRFILPFKENGLLIGTNSDGIFIWDGKNFSIWNPEWNNYFKKNEVNRALINDKGQLVIGTIIDGISIFEQNGELVEKYNTTNGLQNNTVLGMGMDQFNNIWLALDSGIDFLSVNHNTNFHIENIPGIGSVYDAAIFEGNIYLGTNQGPFYKPINSTDNHYQLLPNTQGHIWDCQVIDENLLVSHNDGVILVKNGKAHMISNRSGGFSIKEDPMRKGFLIESTYGDMINLRKKADTYIEDGPIKGFNNLIRYIEIDHLGNIWASHMHRGIFKLRLNEKRDSVVSSTYFGKNSVFGKDNSVHVFKIENRIVFTTDEQLFTYDDLNNEIVPYTELNNKLKDFASAHRIIEAPEHHYWFISKQKIGLFLIHNRDIQLIKSYPRTLFTTNELIENYENILPLSKDRAIVCLENGIAFLDASAKDSLTKIATFVPRLKEMDISNRTGKKQQIFIPEKGIKVSYQYNNIQTKYSFPYYTNAPIHFLAFMKGLDQQWSEEKQVPIFNFDRLPPGDYELQVKAIDEWGNESQCNQLKIEVESPWYSTTYAKVGYILLFLTILLVGRAWVLKKMRKRELLLAEKKEKELIRLRNQNLRTEIEHKSKELANSTIAMVKKNEFLMELKDSIHEQKEQLGTRFPDKYYSFLIDKIDKNISSQDDWKLFETNFERAHEQFLNKLKKQFTELTPGDLKLCAFLRMNLSSKEIAPLLGISVRGVENHRYKLRKKLELDNDDNLTEFLMSL